YTQGRYARFNEAFNFNYRYSKINFFSNLSYNHNHRGEDLFITRNFRDQNTKNLVSIFDQTSYMKNLSDFYSAKVGLDYTASKKTTLGFVVSAYSNPHTWLSGTSTRIYDPNDVLKSQARASTRNDEKWKNFSGNFNITHVIDSTGQEITADL